MPDKMFHKSPTLAQSLIVAVVIALISFYAGIHYSQNAQESNSQTNVIQTPISTVPINNIAKPSQATQAANKTKLTSTKNQQSQIKSPAYTAPASAPPPSQTLTNNTHGDKKSGDLDVTALINENGYSKTIDDLYAHASSASSPQVSSKQIADVVSEYEASLKQKRDIQGLIELNTQLARYEVRPQAYYFKIAQLYYSVGNYDQALSYLYLIQYEPLWEKQASQLISQINSIRNRAVGAVDIPLINDKKKYIATILINGIEAKMLVDTGASISTLNPDMANKMRLEKTTRTLTVHTASESVKTPVRLASTFGFEGFIIENLKVSELELPNPINVDGLLGMDYLQHFGFVLDQDRNVLTLEWR